MQGLNGKLNFVVVDEDANHDVKIEFRVARGVNGNSKLLEPLDPPEIFHLLTISCGFSPSSRDSSIKY